MEAKAEGKAGFDDLMAMLRPLLEDRLQLGFHTEEEGNSGLFADDN